MSANAGLGSVEMRIRKGKRWGLGGMVQGQAGSLKFAEI
jgi:hypothetical protein